MSKRYTLDEYEVDDLGEPGSFFAVAEGTPEDILEWILKQLKGRLQIIQAPNEGQCMEMGLNVLLWSGKSFLILDPPEEAEPKD